MYDDYQLALGMLFFDMYMYEEDFYICLVVCRVWIRYTQVETSIYLDMAIVS